MSKVLVVIVAALLPIGFWVQPALAAGQEKVAVKKFTLRPIASVAGKDMYREYCVRCHGPEGKGDGPEATHLRTPPADLTTIAQRNGGDFASGGVLDKINSFQQSPRTMSDYRRRDQAQNAGEHPEYAPVMPTWGPLFAKLYPERSERTMRLANLVNYLKSIQK
jgi:hypothetical protein